MRGLISNFADTEEKTEEVLRAHRGTLALDIETVSLENKLPVGIGIALDADRGAYFWDIFDPLLKEVLDNSDKLLLHNAKYDLPVLYSYGLIGRDKPFEDTMTTAYALGYLENSLASLSQEVLNKANPSITELWEKKEQGNIGVNHFDVGRTCITHATNTYGLYNSLEQSSLYKEIDRPYVSCLMEMEEWGLYVNQAQLTKVEYETVLKVTDLKNKLKQDLGDINLNSNPQVTKALQTIGVLGTRKTKAGATSVSDESLAPLNHPVANNLLMYRSEMKTISTYIPAFRTVDNKGRMHTDFAYTRTGRLRSRDPNLQNITGKGTGAGLRRAIEAEKGYTFVSFDASQIELRAAAYLSGDPALLEDIQTQDLHMATASRVFGWVDDEDEMKLRRYQAKQLNFAVLYGADAYRISMMAECSLMEAEELISAYFDKYCVLKDWIDTKKREVISTGYTVNMFGRKRPIPELSSGSWKVKEAALREIVNTIVQGTAADIIKMMQLWLKKEVPESTRFVLQVHDEIVMEVPDSCVQEVLECIHEMSYAFPYYPVVTKIGKNYLDLVKEEENA